MNAFRNVLCVMFFVLFSLSTTPVFAQEKTLAQLQAVLISSPWLVTVEGEARTRTLKITRSTQKSGETLLLEAIYGWTDTNQTSILASASLSGQVSTLQFVTQPGSQVTATQTSDGIFTGIFTHKNGVAKNVLITRISEDELRSKIAFTQAVNAASLIRKPTANVPERCASFIGKWVGKWGSSAGGAFDYWLWVIEVDSSCNAKYAYTGSPELPSPRAFKTTTINEDGLTIICVPQRGGICSFKLHGDTLWVNVQFSDVSNYPNRFGSVFRKEQ